MIPLLSEAIVSFIVSRLIATGASFWNALSDEQKARLIETIKGMPALAFEALLNPNLDIGTDLEAGLATISADLSTAMLRGYRKVNDPVVRALFALVLSTKRMRRKS